MTSQDCAHCGKPVHRDAYDTHGSQAFCDIECFKRHFPGTEFVSEMQTVPWRIDIRGTWSEQDED